MSELKVNRVNPRFYNDRITKMKSLILRYPALFSFGVSFVLFLISAASGLMKYEVSDDFLMELIVSGQYGGTPSPYIMFMSPVLGVMFQYLYTWIPWLNWYSWFQIILILISSTVILRSGIKSEKWVVAASAFAIILLISLDGYQLMQFTKTAAFCMCAGFTLYEVYFTGNGSRIEVTLGTLLLILGCLIRFAVFAVVAPLYMLLVLYQMFLYRKQRKQVFRALICMGLSVCSIGVVLTARQCVTLDAGYTNYREYNEVRAEIVDYPHPEYSEIADDLQEIGFDENEYSMVFNWLFSDSEEFSLDQMKNLRDLLREYRTNKSVKQTIKEMYHHKYWLYISFWCCFFVFILICIYNPKKIWVALAIGAAAFLLLFINAYRGRLVYRVEFCLFFSLACVFMELLPTQLNTHMSPSVGIILLTGLMAARAYYWIPVDYQDRYDIMNISWANDLKKYQSQFSPDDYDSFNTLIENSNGKYLLDFNTGIQNYYLSFPVLEPLPDNSFSNLMYLCGVDYLNPARTEKLSELELTGELSDLLDEDVYLVDNGTVDSIVSFLQEKYDSQISARPLGEENGFEVWKLQLESGVQK